MEPEAPSGDTGAATSTSGSGTAVESSPSSTISSADFTSAASTQPPAESSDSSTGEPPRERWPDILDNARKKTRSEVEAEYQWAKGVDRGQFDATRQWSELAERDPILALDHYVQRIAQSPQHAQALRSYMGRALGGSQRDPMPSPDIPTSESNGQPVVYSAQRMQALMAWQARQLQQQFRGELAPLRQTHDQQRAAQQADAYSAQTIAGLQDQPGFQEHLDEIRTAYAATDISDPRSEGEKLYGAYLKVVGPKLTMIARQQAVADITRKTGANTINPSQSATGQPFDYKKASWEDGLKHEWNRRQGKK